MTIVEPNIVTPEELTSPEVEITFDMLVQTLGGMTADEIAGMFRRLNVVGCRQVANACPIANFLSYGTGMEVFVGGIFITCRNEPAISSPISVREFVYLFDRGFYADLESSQVPL